MEVRSVQNQGMIAGSLSTYYGISMQEPPSHRGL